MTTLAELMRFGVPQDGTTLRDLAAGQPGDSRVTIIPPGAGTVPARGGWMDAVPLQQIVSAAQGASNAAAQMVCAPVDVMAWLLKRAGADPGPEPVGGEAWMRRVGLMRDPADKLAGAVGEGLGYVATSMTPGRVAQILKR